MSLINAMSRMTPGESSRLKPMQVKGYQAPKKGQTFNIGLPPGAPKKKAGGIATAAAVNPYDAFSIGPAYDPTKINTLATTGYNEDVQHARNIATLGDLTPAQIDAQSANRAAQQTALGGSLSAALQGIMQAYVGQGNASQAALEGQNAAVSAGGPSIGGVSTATGPVEGLSALIGSQTASGANIYGADAAAALSAGASAAKDAYATGDTTKQTIADTQAGRLASLLSGITSTSARQASMTEANQKNSAADKSTQLAIWTTLQNNSLAAQQSGDRVAIAKSDNAIREFIANANNQTKKDIGITTANAGVKKTKITADAGVTKTNTIVAGRNTVADKQAAAKVKAAQVKATADRAKALATGSAHGRTPSQSLAISKNALANFTTPGGHNEPNAPTVTGYTVTVKLTKPPAAADLVIDPTLKGTVSRKTLTNVNPKDAARLKAGDTFGGGTVISSNQITKKTSGTTVKGAPSAQTRWKRALGALMDPQAGYGMTRTEAAAWLAGQGHPFPKVQ